MNEGPAPTSRVDAFQDSLRQAYGKFDAAALAEGASGSARAIASKALPGQEISATKVRSHRPALGLEWAENAFLLMITQGAVFLDHYGRRTALAAGDMALLDSREGCIIDVSGGARAMTIGLCRSDVVAVRVSTDSIFGLCIPGRRPMSRILAGTIGTILREDCAVEHTPAIRSAVMSLLDQSLDSEAQLHGCTQAERAMLRDMAEWILENPEAIEDGIEALARRFALSRRSLYRLFSRFGTSPSRWLIDVRLRHAYRMLSQGSSGDSVSTVAFATGFADSSHFARAFRQRFGIAPSDLRGRQCERRSPSHR